MVQHLSAEEIIQYISDAKKSTPLKVYVNGNFDGVTFPDSFKVFGSDNSKVIFCEPMIGNHSMNQTNLQLLS